MNPFNLDVATIMGGLYGDGIIACQGAFTRAWVGQLGQDVATLFAEAQAQPGGVLPRGPQRYYVEIHPERLRGLADILLHPWFDAVCSAVLGPDYRVVEVGFDVPGPGAQLQPWHRDFPAPAATSIGRRLDSLAFNLTTVDVTGQMGPLEIAPGTQWDEFATGDGEAAMFPDQALWPRYAARAQRKLPQMGDMSARSALTVHRGTANVSSVARPVLVVGVDAPGAANAARHDLQLTHAACAALPTNVLRHLHYRLVAQLEPIVQAHTIEGLRMGAHS
ncbi:MAG: phytanoyl-CoA dioxygenase family protein [Pseudomonadota bacterium]|nr:phytanoyl-CoA dioxygenase family protein [Pseudomonadota bacterium]